MTINTDFVHMDASPAYQRAVRANNVAIHAYQRSLAKYRTLEIDDDEFNKAQIAKKAADDLFDTAFALEASS